MGRKPNPTKPVDPATPAEPEAPEEVDPDFEQALREPAGGQDDGKSAGGAFDPEQFAGLGGTGKGDLFEDLAAAAGKGREADNEPPRPGSTRQVTDEDLARRGSTDYADDALVTVKLWEWRNRNAEEVGVFQNVLMSLAQDHNSWIPWGGEWYKEIYQPTTRKTLVKKFFKTRGEPAPKTWRPSIGSGGDEDMTPQQVLELITKVQSGQVPAGFVPGMPQGAIPAGFHADATSALRTELGEQKSEVRELRTRLEAANTALSRATMETSEAKSEARHAADKYTELKEKYDELRSEFRELQGFVRNQPREKEGPPDWLQAMTLMSSKRDDGIKATDLMQMQQNMFTALAQMRSGEPNGMAQAMTLMNSTADMLGKMQKAAGVGQADTADKVISAVGKGLEIVSERQKLAQTMQRVETRGAPPAGQQAPAAAAQVTDPKERAKIALDETVKRLMDGLKSGRNEDPAKREDPVVVGEAIAAAIVWGGKTGIAEEDPVIFEFLRQIVADPHKAIGWYCSQNGIPEAYGRTVADVVKRELTPQIKPADPPVITVAAPPSRPVSPPDAQGKPQDALVGEPSNGNGGSHVVHADGPAPAGQGEKGGDHVDVPAQPRQDAAHDQGQPAQGS